jgi:hypothetical protein
MESIAVILGLVGVAMVVLAYGLLSMGRWQSIQPRYLWLNIIGTALILVSLFFQWNLPAVVAQVLWIIISVIGLIRAKRAAK